MKFHSIFLLLSCLTLTACERDVHISNEPLKTHDIGSPRFKVYKTENMWNLLLLDTRTGRLWQAQYSIENNSERAVIPISTKVLANGQDGRFTLTQTANMWTFILTDSTDGRLWQCQYSTNDKDRFCIPIDLNTKEL